jgi:predicted MPP superfamily phosphohydrolase
MLEEETIYLNKSPIRLVSSYIFQAISKVLIRSNAFRELEVEGIEISRLTVRLPFLNPVFDGYRIVQMSDLHYGSWLNRERLESVISLVNHQSPDLIAITGDLISSVNANLIHELINPLSNLHAYDGVLAIRGNHDCWVKTELFHESMKKSYICELNNKIFTITRRGSTLYIVGIDDAYYHLDRLQDILPSLPSRSAIVLLSHEPDLADLSSSTGRFGLQLSGHTHGGQIVIPGIGAPWLPRLGRKYPSGLYQVNGMTLYTNRGVGTSSLYFRYHCPPEITEITLRASISA